MATVEIEEAQLALLRNAYGLFNDLLSDADEGLNIKKVIKKIRPKMAIPEIDAAAPHVKEIDKLRTELTELKTSLTAGYEDYQRKNDWGKAREEFGLTDEGLTAAQ